MATEPFSFGMARNVLAESGVFQIYFTVAAATCRRQIQRRQYGAATYSGPAIYEGMINGFPRRTAVGKTTGKQWSDTSE
jgi:hypothetical protein